MQRLTVDASTNEVAQGLFSALADFQPEILGSADGGYHVVVSLRGSDAQIVAILSAIEQHVTERSDGPARIDIEGRSYSLHGRPTASTTRERVEQQQRRSIEVVAEH